MRTGTKSIKLLYKPLNAYRNTKIVSGSVRQNYDTNTLYFEPDRRIDPLVVLVECGVNDPHNFKNGLVNADLTNVTWKISKAGALVDILDSDKEFQIGKSAEKGQLKVLKNIPDTEAVTLLFTAKYLEPTTKRIVNFQETFTLITSPIAAAPALLELSAPYGHNLFPTKGTEGLVCQADLWRGTKPVAAAYYWYKNGVEITDTNGFQNSKTNKLYVPAAQIPKTGQVYKVEVADCSREINELINDKVDQDSDVINWRSLFLNNAENTFGKNTEILLYNSLQLYESNDAVNGFAAYLKNSDLSFGTLRLRHVITSAGNWRVTFEILANYDSIHYVDICDLYRTPLKPVANKWTFFELTGEISTVNHDYNFVDIEIPKHLNSKFRNFKVSKAESSGEWSPSRFDLQNLISEKTKFYESQTSLPPNYRPATKPNVLYKGDFMLMTKYPKIVEQIIGPEGGINPDIPNVDFEMVLNSADGIIESPEKYYSVGWLKQANGGFKYKGFKIKIPIAEIIQLNAQNKELDYELREDLTLKQ